MLPHIPQLSGQRLACLQSVASRACYLLCRAVKLLRSSLRPLTFDILRGLQRHLGTIAANPQAQAATASKMALSGRGGAPGSLPAATDDRCSRDAATSGNGHAWSSQGLLAAITVVLRTTNASHGAAAARAML